MKYIDVSDQVEMTFKFLLEFDLAPFSVIDRTVVRMRFA